MTRFRVAALGLVVALGMLAWALPATAHQSHAMPATINVTAFDIGFKLSAKSAPSGVVIFKVMNTGKLQHDFSIDGRKTPLLNGGKSNTLRLTLKKGSYPYKCTVPGHAAAGMKGVFVVK
jgi:uncharacterized cupredoxin-like copper-binding protein